MQEEKATGWDFSYLTNTGRMMESPLPWNYFMIICRYLKPGCTLLDLGTGGGEFLSLLPDKEQLRIYATEGYLPNVELAQKKLRSFGGTLVHDYTNDNLPFEDNYFDLVIDRHESYDLKEVYRILRPGGYFITQQVDGNSDLSIAEVLKVKANEEFLHWNIDYALQQFAPLPFNIIHQEADAGFMRFYDAGALLFYIRSMPYLFEEYDRFDFAQLSTLLSDYFAMNTFLDVRKDRFLIVAQK